MKALRLIMGLSMVTIALGMLVVSAFALSPLDCVATVFDPDASKCMSLIHGINATGS